MGKTKQPKTPKKPSQPFKKSKGTPKSKLKVNHTKFSEESKARARSRLQVWKEKQGLINGASTSTASTSAPKINIQDRRISPRLSRKDVLRAKRGLAQQRAKLVQAQQARTRQLLKKSPAKMHVATVDSSSSEDGECSDDDSDIEIIETQPVVVCLDDDDDDDDSADDDDAMPDVPQPTTAPENTPTSEHPHPNAQSTALDEQSPSRPWNSADADLDLLAFRRAMDPNYDGTDDSPVNSPEPPPPGVDGDDEEQPALPAAPSSAPTRDPSPPPAAPAVQPAIAVTPYKPTWSDIVKSNPATPITTNDTATDEAPPLFYDDKSGSIDNPRLAAVPLYEALSDYSMISDKPLPCTPQGDRTIGGLEPISEEPLPATPVITRPRVRGVAATLTDTSPAFSAHNSAAPSTEPISDDSFICERTPTTSKEVATPAAAGNDVINLDDSLTWALVRNSHQRLQLSGRRRKRKHQLSEQSDADDSVIFVSESAAPAAAAAPTASPSREPPLSKTQAKKAKLAAAVAARQLGKVIPGRNPNPATWSRLGATQANPNQVGTQRGQHQQQQQQQRQQQHHHNGNSGPMQRAGPSTSSTAAAAAQPVSDICNTYNPSKVNLSEAAKRMVIIDGSNVAFSHSTTHQFSVRGLAICIEFFERQGHVVKAVVPQMRLKQRMSTDPVLLESLHKQGKVVLTPCKNLPGRNAISYDDRFIMDLAAEFDAAIISNDNYRDLFVENEKKYRPIIETRVIGYTWCMDMILFPKDPYGRDGPTLDDILNRRAAER